MLDVGMDDTWVTVSAGKGFFLCLYLRYKATFLTMEIYKNYSWVRKPILFFPFLTYPFDYMIWTSVFVFKKSTNAQKFCIELQEIVEFMNSTCGPFQLLSWVVCWDDSSSIFLLQWLDNSRFIVTFRTDYRSLDCSHPHRSPWHKWKTFWTFTALEPSICGVSMLSSNGVLLVFNIGGI